mmetsp:Transcript_62238/g.185401  ORF Transcript_62238/g.185401 Transcript_62238/m.185401 type:complete len:213 (-) Transcript_62238:989-1627(-)
MILVILAISWLPIVCANVASRTFKSFPRSGKTPYRSRPMTLRPATARDFALSPSVRISVHSAPSRPPARLASSSFGMPRRRFAFFPVPDLSTFIVLPRSISSFALAHWSTMSTMPVDFRTLLMKASLMSHFDPNFCCFRVMVSLVWESKAGFSMRQLMKTKRWFFTWAGLISMPPRFFPFTTFKIASTSCSVTCTTCVPPLIVLMELTKLTC